MASSVVNIKTTKLYDVYIGRGSIWGNQWSHKKGTQAKYVVATREEAIQKYEEWIRGQPELLERLGELEDRILGCYCKPLGCHGDVLIKLIEERKQK